MRKPYVRVRCDNCGIVILDARRAERLCPGCTHDMHLRQDAAAYTGDWYDDEDDED